VHFGTGTGRGDTGMAANPEDPMETFVVFLFIKIVVRDRLALFRLVPVLNPQS
jgi:hypothetical protein